MRSLKWRGAEAEQAVADAPDFGFIIEAVHLIDGDEFREESEGGAGGVVFELSAVELKALASEGDVLTGDVEILAFESGVVALI
jgi:hypothetical protein